MVHFSSAIDTAVFSSDNYTFRSIFLGQKESACWYVFQINPECIPFIRYIAIYREKPVSAITHYAKVKEFEKISETKWRVTFEGDPIRLPNDVKFHHISNAYFHSLSPHYTQLDALLTSTLTDSSIFVSPVKSR